MRAATTTPSRTTKAKGTSAATPALAPPAAPTSFRRTLSAGPSPRHPVRANALTNALEGCVAHVGDGCVCSLHPRRCDGGWGEPAAPDAAAAADHLRRGRRAHPPCKCSSSFRVFFRTLKEAARNSSTARPSRLSRHDIAVAWAAFFSRWERYALRTGNNGDLQDLTHTMALRFASSDSG